jgi:elongation factor G
VPPQYQGDVMGDVAARRGAVQGSLANDDGTQTIEAEIPTSEIVRYAIDLRSLTNGWGSFSAELDHYQELPSHLVDRAMAAAAAE